MITFLRYEPFCFWGIFWGLRGAAAEASPNPLPLPSGSAGVLFAPLAVPIGSAERLEWDTFNDPQTYPLQFGRLSRPGSPNRTPCTQALNYSPCYFSALLRPLPPLVRAVRPLESAGREADPAV